MSVIPFPSDIRQAPNEPLRKADWIAEHVFGGERDSRWIKTYCPQVRLSRYVTRYYESEVRRWIAEKMVG